MNLLLDTHTFLWFIENNPLLSTNAKDILESEAGLLISIASLWEIAIKVSIGKLFLAQPFAQFIPEQLNRNEIDILPISLPHLAVISTLPMHHKDPFDRLLIAQAIAENLAIVGADVAFDAYPIKRLW